MSRLLYLRNRQRTLHIDSRFLHRLIRVALEEEFEVERYELGVFLVGNPAMVRLNQDHLQHQGSTDVITFDYNDPADPGWLGGDIFVCVPEALAQAQRFRATWQQEVVRYIVHGILHLRGHDDQDPPARIAMKKAENSLVRRLGNRFRFARIGGPAIWPGRQPCRRSQEGGNEADQARSDVH